MSIRDRVLAALAAGFLAGCGLAAPQGLTPSSAGLASIQTVVEAAAPDRTTQEVVTPRTPADVDHFESDLYQLDGATPVRVAEQSTPAHGGTSRTVDWTNLKADTTYEVAVRALDADGDDLDAGDRPATADVTTGLDDAQTVPLAIALSNVVFDGRIHPVVTARPGEARRIDHLELALARASGSLWVAAATIQTPQGAGLADTVDFDHLSSDSRFLLTVIAVSSRGRVIASRTAVVETTDDDRVSVFLAL